MKTWLLLIGFTTFVAGFANAQDQETFFFAHCTIDQYQVDLYRRGPLGKEFPVDLVAGKGQVNPTLANAVVQNLEKLPNGSHSFTVHFEYKWGLRDFTSKDCAPVTRLEEKVDSRDVIPMFACLYFIFDLEVLKKETLESLVKSKNAIPVKAHLLCEVPEYGSSTGKPCSKVTIMDKIIPVEPVDCSLP